MERLTKISDGYYVVTNNDCFEDQDENYCGPAIDNLAAYEDTELTPEEITEREEMFKAYRNVCGGKSPEEITALIAERDTLKKALELMYADNKGYNPDGMGNPAWYIQQAQEQEEKE